MIFLLTVLDSR